jgi:hypothetical protein
MYFFEGNWVLDSHTHLKSYTSAWPMMEPLNETVRRIYPQHIAG